MSIDIERDRVVWFVGFFSDSRERANCSFELIRHRRSWRRVGQCWYWIRARIKDRWECCFLPDENTNTDSLTVRASLPMNSHDKHLLLETCVERTSASAWPLQHCSSTGIIALVGHSRMFHSCEILKLISGTVSFSHVNGGKLRIFLLIFRKGNFFIDTPLDWCSMYNHLKNMNFFFINFPLCLLRVFGFLSLSLWTQDNCTLIDRSYLTIIWPIFDHFFGPFWPIL